MHILKSKSKTLKNKLFHSNISSNTHLLSTDCIPVIAGKMLTDVQANKWLDLDLNSDFLTSGTVLSHTTLHARLPVSSGSLVCNIKKMKINGIICCLPRWEVTVKKCYLPLISQHINYYKYPGKTF